MSFHFIHQETETQRGKVKHSQGHTASRQWKQDSNPASPSSTMLSHLSHKIKKRIQRQPCIRIKYILIFRHFYLRALSLKYKAKAHCSAPVLFLSCLLRQATTTHECFLLLLHVNVSIENIPIILFLNYT